jgi:hypothetical protein
VIASCVRTAGTVTAVLGIVSPPLLAVLATVVLVVAFGATLTAVICESPR